MARDKAHYNEYMRTYLPDYRKRKSAENLLVKKTNTVFISVLKGRLDEISKEAIKL